MLLLLILPRLYAGLGEERYATMLAALALGGLATFVMGGAGVSGLRVIGAAASEGDRAAEAEMFVSLVAVNLCLTLVLMMLAFGAELARGKGLALACVALLPLLQAGLNTTFDNARMAYNEHYRTALLVFCGQLIWYALFFAVPSFSANIFLAATIFHAPITLASAVNGLWLVARRPYLLRGRPSRAAEVLRAGFSFGTAEGLLMCAPAIALIWFDAVATPATTAWFATQTRLFQMCLSPLLMIILPLAAFIRITWVTASAERQRGTIRSVFALGLAGLLGMTIGLGLLGPFYAFHWLGLGLPAHWPTLAAIFILFGTVTCYRIFAAIAYLVLDATDLAHRVIAASLIGLLAGLAVTPYRGPLAAFAVFSLTAWCLILTALLLSIVRALRDDFAPEAQSRGAATADILDIPVTVTDHYRAAMRLLEGIRLGRSCYVCARDVHGLMLAQEDPALCAIHQEAEMVLPDGMPLVHVARLRGHRSIRRVAGPDFVETMADLGRAADVRHYFHGGRPGVAARMSARLRARFPGMVIAGCSSPPFGVLSDAEERVQIATIMASAPDIVWIGLGTPKQERWMHRHYREMPGVTLVGVGAAFDFHAGVVKRAPLWMQRASLEWLHRLLSEPRRLWRRYLLLAPAFLWRLCRDAPAARPR
uniref:WecB/TagA/CpsF family glycosyltransferase n=1 Tax=Sphingomonas bacterium TaxID=1895847 RepID=UPI002632BAE0|nr:WecB/TagA/CpsF family glycosyltransferase [Sphingomonas bacterium]